MSKSVSLGVEGECLLNDAVKARSLVAVALLARSESTAGLHVRHATTVNKQ